MPSWRLTSLGLTVRRMSFVGLSQVLPVYSYRFQGKGFAPELALATPMQM